MIQPGAIVRLRTLRHYPAPPSVVVAEDWTATEGRVYVCLVLGAEAKDGSDSLDCEEVLRRWGWTRSV